MLNYVQMKLRRKKKIGKQNHIEIRIFVLLFSFFVYIITQINIVIFGDVKRPNKRRKIRSCPSSSTESKWYKFISVETYQKKNKIKTSEFYAKSLSLILIGFLSFWFAFSHNFATQLFSYVLAWAFQR